MDSRSAIDLARRVAASFPSSRVPTATLDEWADELAKLTPERGELVLAWLRDNLDSAPTFRQIRMAMARCRPPAQPGDPTRTTPGLDDPCEFCGQPVKNGTDAGTRYDREFDRFFNAHVSCADRPSSLSQTGAMNR